MRRHWNRSSRGDKPAAVNPLFAAPTTRERQWAYCPGSPPAGTFLGTATSATCEAAWRQKLPSRTPMQVGSYDPHDRQNVRFSNRPFEVKRFQTIHHHSVDVARGLVLLFGIGTKALPSWDSKTRRNNLMGGLAVLQTVGPSGHTNSPHPSSREGHHPTARWSSSVLLSHLILNGSYAAATSRVHRNSVPSTQMRCMITANRRASATIAFFIPRCLAIFMAQALSQDHFVERTSMI
jgi:hypothetical protein